MTSRGYILDKISFIANLLALSSHLNEQLIHMLSSNKDEKKYSDESISNISIAEERVTNLRRQIMAKMQDLDPHSHCSLKHASEAWINSIEVYQATREKDDFDAMQEMYDVLAIILSIALNYEYVDCHRCLADRMIEKNEQV